MGPNPKMAPGTMTIIPPPSRIYLLRHARSGWAAPGQSDFDRTLDDQGYADAEILADKAADKGYRPDLLISSTAVRCRETAEAIRRAAGETLEPLYIDALYNAPLDTYLSLLASQGDVGSVMLVGHNPTIEEVLQSLVGTERMVAAIPNGYPTAGLAVLDHAGPGWTLTDFLVP